MADGWAIGLAATKVRPPVLPGVLVRRSRLVDVLDAAVEGHVRFVLVSAPAGSGKSTLIASWLAASTGARAWLQVEPSDSDPSRFWSYLVEAIGGALPVAAGGVTAADDVKAIVAASGGDDLVVVPALVNLLVAADRPLVIVVDDYHLITSERVHRGMERLVELCPAAVTIVLATRADPPFRLGRLRVRKQVAEVRAQDLRFDVDEASALLGPAGRSLLPSQLEQLCERAEGWAAGLVLAGLSLDGAVDVDSFVERFRGDDQLVVEYLRDELLTAMAPGERRRLLETSILEQLSGDLVDAVTGGTDGAVWLRETAARNQLLIRLDRTGTWYRYHHLLRDLLLLQAAETLPDQLPALHDRAAAWFKAHGELGKAIDHRFAAGDLAGVVRLLRTYGSQLLYDGHIETLRGLLDRLGDVAEQVTWCALLYAWCEFMVGHYDAADRWLDAMVEAADDDFDHLVAVALRINLSIARGDVAAAVARARAVPPTQLRSRRPDLSTASGAAYLWAGQVDEAQRCLDSALALTEDGRLRTSRLLALVYLAVVAFETATTAAAQRAAATAVDIAHDFGLADYHGVAPAYAVRARSGDDTTGARADAAHAIDLARRSSTPLVRAYVLAVAGDTLVDLGDRAMGERALVEARSLVDRFPDAGIVARYLARAEGRHRLVPVMAPVAAALVEPLTDRESAVLRYLPTQMSQREIASELYVSLNTVKTHCRAIYRKLGAADRAAAVQRARDLHIH